MTTPPITTASAARRPPRAAHLLARAGLDYGIWIIVASMLLMFVGIGVGYYALAVFARELGELHGWSSTMIGLATGAYFTIGGLTSWVIGPIVDRRGPLQIMTAGVAALGVGVVLVGQVSEQWHLFAVYGVMAVGFGCAASVGINSILGRWFVTRRAQAMSIVFAGVSLGGVILVPLATYSIGRSGLPSAGLALGIVVLLVGLPVTLFVLAWDPADVGAERDLGRPLEVDNANLDDSVQLRVWTRSEAMRTVPFWAILVSFVLVLIAQTGFLIQQIAFLTERFDSAQTASFTLSVTASGSIAARLVVGRFADRIDKRLFTVALFLVQATAVVLVALIESTALTWLLVLVIGFTIGNVYMMQTLLLTEIYGVVSLGAVMGVNLLATQTGSGFGPFGVGWLRDLTDGYTVPFLVTAGMTYLAAGVVLLAKAPPVDDGDSAVGRS